MLLSANEFVRLRNSPDPLDYNRASQEDAPLEVWIEVIDRYPEMREWVAHNKTIPDQVLELLARDEDDSVRFAVAMKRKLTLELIESLSRDADASIRARIARNRSTPRHVLDRLKRDEDRIVVEAAMWALDK